MRNKFIPILLFCLMAAEAVIAQDVTTKKITWRADRVTDKKNSMAWDVNSKFVTSPTTIEWTQTSGKYKQVYTFEITGTDGTWEDAAEDGSITYQVLLRQKPGTITITRLGGVTTVKLIYRSGEQTGLSHEYQIASF